MREEKIKLLLKDLGISADNILNIKSVEIPNKEEIIIEFVLKE